MKVNSFNILNVFPSYPPWAPLKGIKHDYRHEMPVLYGRTATNTSQRSN
jgi:hypothetical protein